jgi:lauroyl/myristoyl acyltransferase
MDLAGAGPTRSARVGSSSGGIARLGRAVIAATRDLDPDRARRAGAALGRSWVRLRGARVDVAQRNLELCFPERDAAWREAILRASFENLGRGLAEVSLLHGRHRTSLLDRVRVEGMGHLEEARAASPWGGALVLTAHFGSWELGGAVFAGRGFPVTSVHRARGDASLDALISSWREGSGQEVVPLGEAGIGALRALRRGRLVLMLMDQNARRAEGVFAPFFGIAASTRSGPALLAARLGVPVVPAFLHRVGSTGEHIGRIHPRLALEPEPLDDEVAAQAVRRHNVAAMNRAIEEAVRSDPAQWVWAHRRFRTRPSGEPALYAESSGRLRRLRHALRGRSSKGATASSVSEGPSRAGRRG